MSDIKYDKIGSSYNKTRTADPYIASRILHFLKPDKNKLYLDIGCGTGNYTIALEEKGFRFAGIDPSAQMLNEAMNRNQSIHWKFGSVENIPFDDKLFDGAIATLTLHHWQDLRKAFSEISRILMDDGRIVLFTSTPEQMEGYWLNHYFPGMMKTSTAQMPSVQTIENAINQNGLEITATEKYFVMDDLRDHFLGVGKNQPEIYFDENIRKGISSFAVLSNAEEVVAGLEKLKYDINNNLFESVRDRYANEEGDYLFVLIEKKK